MYASGAWQQGPPGPTHPPTLWNSMGLIELVSTSNMEADVWIVCGRLPSGWGGGGSRQERRGQGDNRTPSPTDLHISTAAQNSRRAMICSEHEGPHVQVARRKDGDAVVGKGGRGGNHDHSRHVLLHRPHDPQTSQVITSRSAIPQGLWPKPRHRSGCSRARGRLTKTGKKGQTRHTPPQARQCAQHRTYPGSVYPADTV